MERLGSLSAAVVVVLDASGKPALVVEKLWLLYGPITTSWDAVAAACQSLLSLARSRPPHTNRTHTAVTVPACK